MWNTACLDWEERLLSGRSLVPDLPLFKDESARAMRVFKRLRLRDVIGTPTMGEACGPYVFPIVEAIFGSYDPATNRRMIREFFWLIAKKNAKSTSAGGIILTALIVNRRPSAEALFVAPTKKIAEIAFGQVEGMIKLDPQLAKIYHLQRHIRTITDRRNDAWMSIKAADTDAITGGKQTYTLIDETHEFAAKSRASAVFVEIRGALAARPDGFLIQVTTQSKAPPAGVFKAELSLARDVRDGKVKLPLLPILYELPERVAKDGGWKNQAFWHLVNPNLGRSVDVTFLEDELLKAEREGPAKLALIASQHFNVEIGTTQRIDGWTGAEHWAKAADPEITFEQLLELCDAIVIGVDGGGLDDLFGFSALGRHKVTKEWLHWGHAWCHEGVLERRKAIAETLLDFEKAGELTIVGDELSDLSAIVELVRQVKDKGLLAAVAVDPAGLGELVDALSVIGVTEEEKNLIGAPQGFAMMNAIKTCERKLANGTLRHAGQALMAWAVGNLKIEPTATAIRATKAQAGDAKIDPAMSMFDAAMVMATNPTVGSVYEERGLIVFA